MASGDYPKLGSTLSIKALYVIREVSHQHENDKDKHVITWFGGGTLLYTPYLRLEPSLG
jgi:hypothetical protein